MPRPIRAVLFDFDGVIVHSEPIHCRAYVDTAAELGVPLTERRYYDELIGFDDRGAIRHLYSVAAIPIDDAGIARFIQHKSKRMTDLLTHGELQPLPGVVRLLDELSSRAIPAGICSGALRAEIETMLAGIGQRHRFEVIVAAEDVDVGKPDPRGYLLTARRLSEKIAANDGKVQLEPADCLVIEDAPSVASRAASVGFNVVGVTSTVPRHAWPAELSTVPSLAPEHVSGLLGAN